MTICSADRSCTGVPFPLASDWIQLFIKKNPNFNLLDITQQTWDAIFEDSMQEYTSVMDTSDLDLSDFHANGGKMITYHGMADQLIAFNGTVDYYQKLLNKDPNARDFYRFYMAPGMGHCSGGTGASPTDPFGDLVKWVEMGEAPDTLPANHTVNGAMWYRNLCQYPLLSIYQGGDPSKASSYACL